MTNEQLAVVLMGIRSDIDDACGAARERLEDNGIFGAQESILAPFHLLEVRVREQIDALKS